MFKSVNLMEPLARLVAGGFRVFGAVVFALLWIFPAYKGVWLGYLPLAAGTGLGFLIWNRIEGAQTGLIEWITGLKPARFYLIVLLAPLLIQAALLLWLRPEPMLDARQILDEARTLAETGQMNPITYYAPAQTWWFAFFFRLCGASPLVAQLSLIPLFLALILTTHGLMLRWAGHTAARLSALLVAAYPSLLLYVLVTPYYFYLYTLLVMVTVFAWLSSSSEQNGRAHALAGGLSAGFCALTKAVFLAAPAQALLFYALSAGRFLNRLLWKKWLLFLLAFALVLAPWVIRNFQVFGRPVLVCTSGGLVLYSANNPFSNGLYNQIPDVFKVSSPQAMLEHSRRCSRLAWTFIRENPRQFLRLAGLKIMHTWGNETTYTELINRQGRSSVMLEAVFSFAAQTGWAALVTLWLARAGRRLRRHEPPSSLELAVALLVLGDLVTYSVYEGGARHHLPAVPLLVAYVCAGIGPFSPKREATAEDSMGDASPS